MVFSKAGNAQSQGRKRRRETSTVSSPPSKNEEEEDNRKNKNEHKNKNKNRKTRNSNSADIDIILKDVCICLTGITSDKKSKLHSIVENLGGTYIRDLVTPKTTHLIAEQAGGNKYAEAKKCAHIEIVTPKWLEECNDRKMRLSTKDFLLVAGSGSTSTSTSTGPDASLPLQPLQRSASIMSQKMGSTGSDSNSKGGNKMKATTESGFQNVSYLKMATKSLLEGDTPLRVPPNPLFSSYCFFLVGFPRNELGFSVHESKLSSSTSASLKLKHEFCKLIRRCMGTIFWEVNKDITHVIVNEGCDLKVRTDVSNFCQYHPNAPQAIAPEWVIACLQNKRIMNEKDYPPNRRLSTLRVKKKSAKVSNKKRTKVQLFSGMFFHILPVQEISSSPKSSNASSNVDGNGSVVFSSKTFEKLIVSNGGQLVSRDGIKVLQNQHSSSDEKIKSIPTCYVVHLSGSFDLHNIINSNVVLKHISQHKLCNIKPVNPIWLKTCEMNNVVVDPTCMEYDRLFQPQNMPILRMQTNAKIKVSVTGFVGAERVGMRNMLDFIGAAYTDDMSNTNTHLICKEAAGQKYLKAVEWKLHVVTVEWLYHIVYHGYVDGGEHAFSLLEDETKKEEEDGDNSQDTIICSQDFGGM